jgi:hypothetical protein
MRSYIGLRSTSSSDALTEIDSFFRKQHKVIVPLTVKEILGKQILKSLALANRSET